MDKRIIGAVVVLGVLLLGGVGAYVMTGSSGPDAPPAANGPKKGQKAKVKAGANNAANDGTRKRTPRPGDPAKNDPTYEERAKKHREIREAKNAAWREQTTVNAQQWVANSGLDEATGLQVMAAFNKAHDTIAQSRADVEEGVIHPREGRDEQKWAKEDLRVELKNLLGDEKSQEFLDAVKAENGGGI